MDKKQCNSCGAAPHKCSCKNKEFTKAVIEIDNPEQITLMRRVVIPASMGDDTAVPPVVGKYHNVLLYYEANQKSYLYSSDGIPTQLVNGLTDYEAAVNLPQINGNTLIGDKTGEELGLQDKLTAGDNVTIENNTISATDTTYGPATDAELGLVKPGDGLEVDTDGTLSISDIEQYAHFFDTVADMKAATNLVAGDYARTGGFHSINDDGGALYYITDTGTANEMDVIATGDNLYANLVLPCQVNVKQFGAYGDGVHDDTTTIQAAIDHIDNYAKAHGRSTAVNVLGLPAGKYKTTDTINLKTTVKLRTLGFASIEFYGTGTCLWVMNDWQTGPSTSDRMNAGEWLQGALIDGVGLLIKNMNATDSNSADDRGDTIGVEIGIKSYDADTTPNNRVSVANFKNMRIANFHIGLKKNTIYTWCTAYEDIYILRCDICVQFAESGMVRNNGGERDNFTNFFASNADIGFLWYNDFVPIVITNCSLDYVNAGFVCAVDNPSNPINISFVGGHIEGIGEGPENGQSGYSGLVCGSFKWSKISFEGVYFAFRNNFKLISDTNISPTARIIMDNIATSYTGDAVDQWAPDTIYMSDFPIEISNITSNSYVAPYADGTCSVLLRQTCDKNNLISHNLFDNIATGTITITTNSPIGSMISNGGGNFGTGEITEDSPLTGGKVLTIGLTGGNSTFNLKTDKIPATPNRWYKANLLTKYATTRNVKFMFYDKDDNLLFETNEMINNANIDRDKWYMSAYSKAACSPKGTSYMVVNYKVVSNDNTGYTNMKIGGVFLEAI